LPGRFGTIAGIGHAETFLQFARRTRARPRVDDGRYPSGHHLADSLGGTYGRSRPPTASWAELRAYLAAEGASPTIIEDARSAWRAWERQQARAAQLALDI
jgi:hypothetical protein